MKCLFGLFLIVGTLNLEAYSFAPTAAPDVIASRRSSFAYNYYSRSRDTTRQDNNLLRVEKDSGNGEFGNENEQFLQRRSFLVVMGASTVPFLSVSAQPASAVASKDLKEDYRQGTAALAEMDDQAPVPRSAYKKLESGVIYADLRPGSGTETVGPGSRVNLQWVLRKSNGYFVDSSERNGSVPFIFNVGDGTAIKGLDEAVRGMKAGGVRRVLIPPSLAYVQGLEDGKPGPLPVGFGPRQQMRRVQEVRKDVPGEYVYLEVQLTRMR